MIKKTLLLLGLLCGSVLFVKPADTPAITNITPKEISIGDRGTGITIAREQAGIKYKFQYVDDYGVTLPLRGLLVELHTLNNGVDKLADTTYTDRDGYASFISNAFTITGAQGRTYPCYVKIISKSTSTGVVEKYMHYYDWQSGTVDYSLEVVKEYIQTFRMDSDTGRAFAITQPLYIASQYGRFLNNGEELPMCPAVYPDPNVLDNQAYYSAESIHLSKKIHSAATLQSIPNIYQDYDTICHEYGHHVQSCLDLNAGIGGSHYSGVNCQDEMHDRLDDNLENMYSASTARMRGICLSYSEGWATSFSLLAQKHFASYLENVRFAADSRMDLFNYVHVDYSTYEVCLGEGSEESITTFIWNLFDKYNVSDPHDLISLSDELFITFSKGSKMFSDFYMKVLESDIDMDALLYLTQRLNMSPTQVAINETMYRNISPIISWSTSGGSIYYPNNDFDIYIEAESYGEYERYHYHHRTLKASPTASFRMPLEDWINLIDLGAETFSIRIVGNCDWYNIQSGGYSSQTFVFESPTEYADIEDPVTFAPAEWLFEDEFINDYDSLEIEKDGHTFETSRLRTICLNDKYLVLSARNISAGKAMLEITSDYAFESVEFECWLYSNNEKIAPRNSKIKFEIMTDNGEWIYEHNLWNSISADSHTRIVTYSAGPLRGVRWCLEAEKAGPRDLGRVCIGNITFNF